MTTPEYLSRFDVEKTGAQFIRSRGGWLHPRVTMVESWNSSRTGGGYNRVVVNTFVESRSEVRFRDRDTRQRETIPAESVFRLTGRAGRVIWESE